MLQWIGDLFIALITEEECRLATEGFLETFQVKGYRVSAKRA